MMYDELIELMRYCANDNPVCEKLEACPFYNQAEEDYGYYFCVERMLKQSADAIEDLITALTASNEVIAKNKPKWIPVTDRLPEYGEKCLVVRKLHSHNDIRIDVSYCYVQREGFWSDNGRDWHVTHWMPLPQPPESEGE